MSRAWFDHIDPLKLEARCLRFLTSLSQAVVQFSKFNLKEIGPLQDTEEELLFVGPCCDWR